MVTANLSIGVTENVTAGTTLAPGSQLLSDLVGLGNGVWLRWQQKWTQVETSRGVYVWTNSDQMVATANANNINVLYQIQSPPVFRQTLDGLGSNATLSGPIGPGLITSIPVNALPAGCYIPAGMSLSINFGGGTAEVVTTSTPLNGKFTGAGATSIPVNSFTLVNAHSAGEPVVENTGGFNYANAFDFAQFAQLVASRYNGQNGHGSIQALQIENENYDAANRIKAEVLTTSWDGSSTWDNGGAILAPVFSQSRQAVLQVYPGLPVLPCSVRRTGGTPGLVGCLSHGANWTQGFVQGLTGGQIPDWFDTHFYHGSDQSFDGALVSDPTLNTYVDATLTQISSPAIQVWIPTLQNQLSSIHPSPLMLVGEMGWDLFDDGSGQNFTTNQIITAGVPLTQITVNALAGAVPNGEPIWIDNLSGQLVETGLYAFGTAAINATVVKVTTDPRGNGTVPYPVAQIAWTPLNTHASGVNCYGQKTTDVISAQLAANYFTKMFTYMNSIGGKCFFFTDLASAVLTPAPPFPAVSSSIKSVAQTVAGQYTLYPPYYAAQLAGQANPQSGQTLPDVSGQQASLWYTIAYNRRKKERRRSTF